jgi:hypothetical protein
MKKTLVFLIVCVLFACSDGYKEKGEIKLKNGEGQEMSIPYEIGGFARFSKIVSKEDFNFIVHKASEVAKTKCKDKRTYVPLTIVLWAENDTINTTHCYTADGVPDEFKLYCSYIGTDLIESF